MIQIQQRKYKEEKKEQAAMASVPAVIAWQHTCLGNNQAAAVNYSTTLLCTLDESLWETEDEEDSANSSIKE